MADGVGPVCRAAAAEKESRHWRKKKEGEKEGLKAVERIYILATRVARTIPTPMIQRKESPHT